MNADGTAISSDQKVQSFVTSAKDIFTTGNSEGSRPAGTYISDEGLNGLQMNWTGWKGTGLGNDGKGGPASATFTQITEGSAPTSSGFLGLTAGEVDPSKRDELIAYVTKLIGDQKRQGVLIQGNYSAMHGGGIAVNGLLIAGENEDSMPELPELEVEKNFIFGDGTNTGLNLKDSFEFTMSYTDDSGKSKEISSKTGSDGNPHNHNKVKFDVSQLISSDVIKAELDAKAAAGKPVNVGDAVKVDKTYTVVITEKTKRTDKMVMLYILMAISFMTSVSIKSLSLSQEQRLRQALTVTA